MLQFMGKTCGDRPLTGFVALRFDAGNGNVVVTHTHHPGEQLSGDQYHLDDGRLVNVIHKPGRADIPDTWVVSAPPAP